MKFITSDVLAQLRALPARSVSLVIIVPPEEEDLILDDLVKQVYRVLRKGGEAIVGKSLPDALELL